MKEKSRNAVENLMKTLWTLLAIDIIGGFVAVVIMIGIKIPNWWNVIVSVGPTAIILGVLLAQLSNAFYSIIEDMEELAIEDVVENKSQQKNVNRVKSKPAVSVMSDDYNAFCEKVNSALDGVSRSKQIDWLEYWLEELEAKCAETTDADKQSLYNDQIAYIDLSLKSLS